jgi:hypothetical protein
MSALSALAAAFALAAGICFGVGAANELRDGRSGAAVFYGANAAVSATAGCIGLALSRRS